MYIFIVYEGKCKMGHVGAKVQNSSVLGLGLARVQIDNYWILVLIREPEIPRKYE